jgi:hypothetical protein
VIIYLSSIPILEGSATTEISFLGAAAAALGAMETNKEYI